LHTAISSHDAGDKITVTWTDSTGGTRTASITLAEAPVS
jgi:S1-C subfamily serine protease